METVESTPTTREPGTKASSYARKRHSSSRRFGRSVCACCFASRCRDLALFNLSIDGRLRACDLMQKSRNRPRCNQSVPVGGTGR
jgi:hypothetical protein